MYVLPPLQSLDVTRTHLEMNRLGNLWLKKNTLTKKTPTSAADNEGHALGSFMANSFSGGYVQQKFERTLFRRLRIRCQIRVRVFPMELHLPFEAAEPAPRVERKRPQSCNILRGDCGGGVVPQNNAIDMFPESVVLGFLPSRTWCCA